VLLQTREVPRRQLAGAAEVRHSAAAWVTARPGSSATSHTGDHPAQSLGAASPLSDRIRPGRAQSASGGLADARLHAIALPQLMSSATRQVVCLQDFTASEHLETADLRRCYRLDPDLPTNCGSPDREQSPGLLGGPDRPGRRSDSCARQLPWPRLVLELAIRHRAGWRVAWAVEAGLSASGNELARMQERGRCTRSPRLRRTGRSRVRAASRTRSVQLTRGRGVPRWSTASWWVRTRISISLAVSDPGAQHDPASNLDTR